jgi:hypothetical protein
MSCSSAMTEGRAAGGTVVGIRALGEISPETFEVIEHLEGPRITGFTSRGFTDSGIIALATDRFHASHNRTGDNAGYGIFAIASTRPVLAYNKATGNGDAGLYVTGRPDRPCLSPTARRCLGRR